MILVEILSLIRQAVHEGWYSPQAVAAKVYDVPASEVTPAQRAKIKQLAYPILYGRDQ